MEIYSKKFTSLSLGKDNRVPNLYSTYNSKNLLYIILTIIFIYIYVILF